ncbi:MAG: autotransporter-associated beta strand repeat-containing protein [Planctomycetales bacterium]|nr:autotransporter-associated beta strand repeat-containing protein [Planctomycetales bacterium]
MLGFLRRVRLIRRVRFCAALIAAIGLAAPPQLLADAFTWTGGGTASAPLGGFFSLDGNWLGGDAPPGATPPDTLTFGGAGAAGYAVVHDLTLNPPELSGLTLGSSRVTAVLLRGEQFSFSNSSEILQTGSGQFLIENNLDLVNPLTLRGAGTGLVSLAGIISGTGNITKSEASTYVLRGLNTYDGLTTISAGTLIAAGNVKFGEAGALGNSGSAVTLSGGSFYLAGQATMSRSLEIGGAATFGNNTVGTVTMSGDLTFNTNVALTLNAVTGGNLLLQGSILSPGSVTIGSASTFAGSVRMTSANNYTGTTTLTNGRLSIGANTNYTGTAAAPTTIISGPLGTGTFSFGSGTTVLAIGGAREIVNPIVNVSTSSAQVFNFGGADDLTFTRNWTLYASTAAVSRTFNVVTNPGVITFSGNLLQGAAGAITISKTGRGTLVLGGSNTFSGGLSVTGGTVRISSNAGLGATAAALTLNAGTLQVLSDVALPTTRAVALGANGGTLSAGPGARLDVGAAISGAFALAITGGGTVSLNGATTAATTVTVGGATTLTTTQTAGQTLVGGTTGTLILQGATLAVPAGATTLAVPRFRYDAGATVSLADAARFAASEAAATAFARTNFGTLVLTSAGTLGGTEQFTITNAAAQPGVTSGLLTLPSIVWRDAAGDADFVTYGANGFALKTATTTAVSTLAASAATSVWQPATGTNSMADATLDVLALRTAGNISSGGANSLLRIASGGLIINGDASAPQINVPLQFGTSTVGEALVYVKGGYTSGTATLGGSITAANFTKFGPGTLRIAGSSFTLVPSATGLRNVTIQQGVLQFAGGAAVPSAVFTANDTGTLDVAGLELTVGGLAGTGIVGNSGAAPGRLIVASDGQTTTFSGTLQDSVLGGTSTLGLTKSGTGTLVLSGRSTFTGGTIVNAGVISSSTGVYSTTGALQVNDLQGLGTGPITIAGGILDFRYDSTAFTDVIRGLNVVTLGAGAGYDVTIAALNNFGAANVTSTLTATTTSGTTATFLSYNNLTINAPVLNVTGASLGVRIGGTTTLAGNTILNVVSSTLALDGPLVGGTNTITKLGAGTLILSGTSTTAPTTLGGLTIGAGTVDVRMIGSGSHPLGSADPVMLAGSTLIVRHEGDGSAASEFIDAGFGIVVNATTMAGALRTANGLTTLTLGAIGTSANKTLAFDSLMIGGVQGTPSFLVTVATAANNYSAQFGATTFTRDAMLTYNVNVTHLGAITGDGTLYRAGTGNVYMGSDNAYAGGTILAGGNVLFGSYVGTTYVPAALMGAVGKLGSGKIAVLPGAGLQITTAANLNAGQTADVRSNLTSLGVLRVAGNLTPQQAGLRSIVNGLVFNVATGSSQLQAGGLLAINTGGYSHALDLAKIGDGSWFLGSTQDGAGQDGVYTAATLGVGLGNTYRLGGGAAYVGSPVATAALHLTATNVLTGTAALQVGAPYLFNIQNAQGNIVLRESQNYTGATTIHRNSSLELRGTAGATSGYDVFGSLALGGAGGTVNGFAGAINLYPGSTLRFDNTVATSSSRWMLSNDVTPVPLGITLNSATLSLVGNAAGASSQDVGLVTLGGGAGITLLRGAANVNTTLNLAGIARSLGQTLAVTSTTARLGVDERLFNSTASAGFAGGWMVNATDNTFLTYAEATGYGNAPFTLTQAAATLASSIGNVTSDVISVTGALTLNGANINALAMRITATSALTITKGTGTPTINIGSGGLIGVGAVTHVIQPDTLFAQSLAVGEREAVIYNAAGNILAFGDVATGLNGQITADHITKFGPGTLQLDAVQQTFVGNIHLNAGSLILRNNIAAGSGGGRQAGNGGSIFLNANGVTLSLRGDVATTFLNSVVMAQDVATTNLTFQAAVSGSTLLMKLNGGITFQGAAGQQQVLNLTGASAHNLEIGGLITLNGSSVFNLLTASTVTLSGQITGTGSFGRTGIGTNFILSNLSTSTPNNFSGGVQLHSGLLTAYAAGTNPIAFPATGQTVAHPFNNSTMTVTSSSLGTGPITLYGGELRIFADGSANSNLTEILPLGNNVIVAGNATIAPNQLTTTGGTYNRIALGSLTIGSQTLTSAGGNSYALSFSSLNVRGTPTLSTTTPMMINGATTDNGASALAWSLGVPAGTAAALTKLGAGDLYFNGAVDLNNGLVINAGNVRTGQPWNFNHGGTASSSVMYPNTSVRYGTGTIIVNPGGSIKIDTGATLSAGQQIKASSAAFQVAGVRLQGGTVGNTISMALLQNMLTPDSTTGVLMFDGAAAYSGNTINMALLGDGTWYIATGQGSTTIGTSVIRLLPGAPATPGGLPAYRFGSVTSQLQPGADNILTGDARAIFGGLASNTIGSTVSIYNSGNNYTGGTDMMRGQSTGQVNGASETTGSPDFGKPLGISIFGSGAIELYGSWTMYQFGTQATADGLDTLTAINFHPGSIFHMTPDTSNVNSNRLGDNTFLNFDGNRYGIQSSSARATSSETIAGASFARGTSFRLLVDGTGGNTQLIFNGALQRTNDVGKFHNGTLTIQTEFAAGGPAFFTHSLGSATMKVRIGGAASLPHALYGTVNAGSGAPTGMAPAYIVNASDLTFVTYDEVDGFKNLLPITSPAAGQTAYQYVVNVANSNIPLGITGGTATLAVETAAGLAYDPSLFGLRAAANITNAGRVSTIYFTSDAPSGRFGGLIGAGAAVTIDPNLNFGNGAGEALIFNGAAGATGAASSTSTLTLNGLIQAGSVTKFGLGTLIINRDQTNYSGGWIVNQGALQLNTLGAAGQAGASNRITLNGPVALNLSVNSGNPLNTAYSIGTVYSVDDGTINYRPGADDRTATIGDIVVQNTAPWESAQPARFTVAFDRNRAILQAGVLRLEALQTGGNSNAQIVISGPSSANPPISSSSGLHITGLSGVDQYTNLRKWGSGTLYVAGDSASSWNSTLSIEQGAVHVLSQNALGGGNSVVNVMKNGVLEIGIAGYTRDWNLTYAEGSAERWAVDNARIGPGVPAVINLGKGTLQIGADQTSGVAGTLTVRLNGGSIEGFLRNDDQLPAVYRTVGAGVGFQLDGDSYLGQNVLHGTNGVDNGKAPTFNSPFANSLTGALLELKGAITGSGSLTKISYDTVILSGQSTFTGGLNITAGIVQIAGGNDRLPVAGRVVTSVGGVLDLNGFNQQIGSLASAHGLLAGVAVDGGWIYNSATTTSTLSVGTSAIQAYTYGGILHGNIALTKTGGPNNVLTLLGANTYSGGTTLAGGVLGISGESFLGAAGTGLTFNGGALRFTADGSLTRPVTLTGTGTLQAESGKTVTVTSSITGPGGLRFDGLGTVRYQSTGGYAGTTDIVAGTLAIVAGASTNLGASDIRLFGGRVIVANEGVTPLAQIFPGLIASGSGTLVINGTSSQMAVGFLSFARAGRGTLQVIPQIGAFASTEQLALGFLTSTTNGIVAPWAVVQTSGGDSSGDFLGFENYLFSRATYTNAGSVDNAASTSVFNADMPSTLTGDRITYALKTNQVVDGGFTLTIGDGTGQAGLILNAGSIQTAGLAFGGAEGLIYAGGAAGSSIGAAISGTAGVTKFGPQTLTLTGRNTYAGGTAIYGGALVVSQDANLGAAGGGLIIGGGTLETSGRFTAARNLQIDAAGAVVNVIGSGKFALNGIVSGASLTKIGTGTLSLGGVNTFTGDLVVSAGKLAVAADAALGDASSWLKLDGGTLAATGTFTTARAVSLGAAGGTFDVAATKTLTYTGSLTGSGGLTKTGDGTLVVAANTTYAGSTTVAGGTLRLAGWNQYTGATTIDYGTLQATAIGPSKGPLGQSASLTLNNGTLQLVGATQQTMTGVAGALTVGGGGTILLDTSAGFRTALTFGSLARGAGSGTLVVVPWSGNLNNTDASLTGGDFLGFSTAPTLTNTIIAPWAVRQESATDSTGDFLTLTGTFVQRAAYSALTDPNAVTSTTVFRLQNSGMLTGAKEVYAIRLDAGTQLIGNFALTVGATIAQAGVILNGAELNVGTLAFAAREGMLYAGGTMPSGIAATITGTGGLTKFGDQTLVISGANDVTGVLSLNGGKLSVAVDGGLGGTSGSSIRFNGGTLLATDSFVMHADRGVSLGAGYGTFEVADGKTLAIPTAVAGVGGFVKAGLGTLSLQNVANNFTGGTRIDAGTLALTGNSQLTATAEVRIAAGATLFVAENAAITSPADVQIAGAAQISGNVAGYANVTTGGVLTGDGRVGGVDIGAGGKVSPGYGIGTLEVATTLGNALHGGGSFEFQFKTADFDVGTPGTQGTPGTHWDYLDLMSGALEITATADNRFTLYVDSWLADGSGHGAAADFDPLGQYSWKFLEANGGISFTSGSSDVFSVDATQFNAGVFGAGNPYTLQPGRGFFVSATPTALYLMYDSYATVPEPSSLLLTSLAAGAWAWRRRRNRRACAVPATEAEVRFVA